MLPLLFHPFYGQGSFVPFVRCYTATFLEGFFLKFCMEVYLDQIYTSLVFGNAATFVPSVIGSKVIFWCLYFVCSNCHISWQISFKFWMKMYVSWYILASWLEIRTAFEPHSSGNLRFRRHSKWIIKYQEDRNRFRRHSRCILASWSGHSNCIRAAIERQSKDSDGIRSAFQLDS